MPNIVESLEQVISALNRAEVRYLVAGGLAVNAHGHSRATHDIDLIVKLERENIEAATDALSGLGYQPLAPVSLSDFADAARREEWVREKGLTVFGLVSERHPQAPVDLFVDEPFDFDREYAAALRDELAPGVPVTFVSLEALIEMKKRAARPRDLDDVEQLSVER